MDIVLAWKEALSFENPKEWQPIREEVRKTLHLPGNLGCYGGMLCTKVSATGVQRFLDRLNSIASGVSNG